MKNKNVLSFWEELAKSNPTEKTVKVNSFNDLTRFDADFIMRYANKNSEILDLASGSGLTINKIYDKVKHIVAVELFEEFTKFIDKSDNVSIFHEDITSFTTNSKFDIVTMFGIVQYLEADEISKTYKKYFNYLKPNGAIIIKGQFGVKETVLVSGFSKELNKEYYSNYRHIDKETEILKNCGFKDITVFDIYPPECNRWDNTHFYAIVGKK